MIIDRTSLLAALRLVKPGIDKNSTNISGMDCFIFMDDRVYAHDDAISLSTATDLSGSFAVSAVEFYSLLSKFKAQTLDIEVGESCLEVKCGKAKASVLFRKDDVSKRIRAIAPDEHDWIPLPKDFSELLPLCEIKNLRQDVAAKMGGVFIQDKTMISTDNASAVRVDFIGKDMDRMWLSASTVKLLCDVDVTHYCSTGAWLHFSGEKLCVSCRRQIDENYPHEHIKSIFSSVSPGDIFGTMNREVANSLAKAAIFAKDTDGSLVVGLTFGDNVITISSESSAGKYEEDVDCIVGCSAPKTIHVNVGRLQQVLNRSQEVEFNLGTLGGADEILTFTKGLYTEVVCLCRG